MQPAVAYSNTNATGRMAFEIIPVIDLRHGVVVHARRGERERYRPIDSPLVSSSAPLKVVRALLDTFGLRTLYIADLDALVEQRPQRDVLERIAAAFPACTLWLDAGIGDATDLARVVWPANVVPVVATETLCGTSALPGFGPKTQWILSLDHRAERVDPARAWEDVGDWPERVIVMTLERVGNEGGPDFERIAVTQAHAARQGCSVSVYAAGGVRSRSDLERLSAQGVRGALIATALHSGALSPGDVAHLVQ